MQWFLVGGVVLMAMAASAQGDEKPPKLTIATWNLEWFFDEHRGDNYSDLAKKLSAPTRSDWDWKRNEAARVIAAMQPTILALQEVENRQVVWYLCRRLKEFHDLNYRIAFIDGADYYTEQDVALIYQSGLVEFSRREQSNEQWRDKQLYQVQKHLFARFQWGEGDQTETIRLLNVHLRSAENGAGIRQRQARLARGWLEPYIARQQNVVVLGDLNTNDDFAQTPPDGEIGILRGLGTTSALDDLLDLHAFLQADQRDTHLIGKQFDRILISRTMLEDAPGKRDLVFREVRRRKDLVVRGQQDKDHRDGYYEIPEPERDVSDHYPVIAEFQWK